jgi:membrane-bound lytic murein transglycosylase D
VAAAPLKLAQAKPLEAGKPSSRKAAREPSRPLRYTVRRGDTLYGIAQRFDVEVDDLRRWNRLGRKDRIQPGDVLVLARAG